MKTNSIPERLTDLRTRMREAGVEAYLIPSTDAHQSEYVPACWQRRQWISGFTGSAGDVLVTLEEAGLWTDSRYYIQAETQLEGSGIALFKSGLPNVPTMETWLARTLNNGDTVGVDPRVTGIKSSETLNRDLAGKDLVLKLLPDNLIDLVWENRPHPSDNLVGVLGEVHSGEPLEAKLARVRDRMKDAKVDTHVVTAMDAIAWLYNLRGSDVDYNPVFIAYAAVTDTNAYLFVDETKLTQDVRTHLGGRVDIRPYADIEQFLLDERASGASVWMDEGVTNRWIADLVGDRGVRVERSPISGFKAVKNATELSGIRKAHTIDGVAMVKFLKWLEETVGVEPVSELSAAARLLSFREEGEGFVGPSFPTISGYGAHGAIVHYSVEETSDIPLGCDSLYLVDSGGQYQFGTTDITRTLCFGEATDEQREMYTRVLKGHIELTTLSFPNGTSGQHIDLAARRPLWDAGRNYLHGTGHGIGHYLNVHEGPISISSRAAAVKLTEGHVLSNEPGYYADGDYGIRTENLVTVVQDLDRSIDGQKFMKFETLTRCPIQTDLIDIALLGKDSCSWLNEFHATVRETLCPMLDKETASWLEQRTQPI
jgi:Xaa-Pro aminopeptidase